MYKVKGLFISINIVIFLNITIFTTLANNKGILTTSNKQQQFVSINLCSDRVLQALAKPEQIAALSKNAFDKNLYLEQPNANIKAIGASINDLIAFYNSKIIIDKQYNSLLYNQLKSLGFQLIDITIPSNEDELHQLIIQIGQLTDNSNLQRKLINQINKKYQVESAIKETAIIISEGLVIDNGYITSKLLSLLSINQANIDNMSRQNKLSLEQLLLLKTNYLIVASLAGNDASKTIYNDFSMASSLLQRFVNMKNNMLLPQKQYSLPSKYQLCFDQGIWQGARYLQQLITSDNKSK